MKTRHWLIEARGDFSQVEVANKAKITQQAYSAIENGSRNPSVKIAKEIAKALNFDWTLFYSDEPSKQDKANQPPTNENT